MSDLRPEQVPMLWARLLRRVTRTPEGCWRFTGSVNSRGYGLVANGVKGQTITAHRLAVLFRDGSVPDGMTIDHQCHDSQVCAGGPKCPHRRCVNPSHLEVMTNAANNARRWVA
jgi:hypothetical protein